MTTARKLTEGILEELREYFSSWMGGDQDVAAQGYEFGGHEYDPATDKRLARLVLHRCINPEWARVRRIIDEMTAPTVEVLRLAVANASKGYPLVACLLPSALAQGRALALAAARENALDLELRIARRLRLSPMACAMRVLAMDAEFQTGRRRLQVTSAEVRRATELGVTHGDIDVADESTGIVNAAVDQYTDARERLDATRRAMKARRAAENERLLEEALGKVRRRRERRERESYERRIRRAS